jgi:hypothetical protein
MLRFITHTPAACNFHDGPCTTRRGLYDPFMGALPYLSPLPEKILFAILPNLNYTGRAEGTL